MKCRNYVSKKNKGITLIALAITIIVMLILSGVTLNLVLGEDGIVGKALLATDRYKQAQENEERLLQEAYATMMLADSNGTTLQNMNMTTLEALIQSKIDASKDSIKEEAKLELYPVGSIYISTTNTNPGTFIGGTWESYGEGRTLIGAGIGTDTNNESKSFIANSTGGEYKHTLTTAEMPSHTHGFSSGGHAIVYDSDVGVLGTNGFASSSNGWWHIMNKNGSDIAYSGGSQPHNNIQPYIVTYMWKRIE